MSKYDALWAYIQGRNEETLVLSFADIAQIAGTPLEQRPDQRGICRFYLGAFKMGKKIPLLIMRRGIKCDIQKLDSQLLNNIA